MKTGSANWQTITELVETLNEHKAGGADFPTLWTKLLRNHPLVSGIPVQAYIGIEPVLKVELVTGQALILRGGTFHLEP